MQQQGRIAEEIRKQVQSLCCEYVLAHACRFDDPTFPKNSKALAVEDTNIQSILFSSPTTRHIVPSDIIMEALIAFSWYRCDTKPNLEIADHALTAAKASGVLSYRASAGWCLGQTYAQLGDHHSSYAHQRDAYRLFNTLPPGDVELQRLGGQCGIDLGHNARLVLRANHEAVSLARDVETKCAALSDNIIHGHSLVLLGAVLIEAGQPQEALRCLDQARTMLKGAGNTYTLAVAYQFTSWAHYGQGRLPEALDAIEEAWKLARSTATQAVIPLDFARTLFSTNRDTEAWEYLQISLMRASYMHQEIRENQI
jgi:tetratricopeptide (TPR) repeat protein